WGDSLEEQRQSARDERRDDQIQPRSKEISAARVQPLGRHGVDELLHVHLCVCADKHCHHRHWHYRRQRELRILVALEGTHRLWMEERRSDSNAGEKQTL